MGSQKFAEITETFAYQMTSYGFWRDKSIQAFKSMSRRIANNGANMETNREEDLHEFIILNGTIEGYNFVDKLIAEHEGESWVAELREWVTNHKREGMKRGSAIEAEYMVYDSVLARFEPVVGKL